MVLLTSKSHRWLLAAVTGALLAGAAHAQVPSVGQATAGEPATAPISAAAGSPSAFEGYKLYTDEPVGNWKAANEAVAKIGGWREYAKQAQQLENTPASAGRVDELPAKADVKADVKADKKSDAKGKP